MHTQTMTQDAALRLVAEVEGQIHLEEAAVLMELAAAVPGDRVIVEIGSYRGRSTVALALGSQARAAEHGDGGARVIAVDPHVRFIGARGGVFGPVDQAAMYANLCKTGVGETVAMVSLASVDAAGAWRTANVGLLWLDGDHTESGLTADLNAWTPHLAPGAIVAFHDADYRDVATVIGQRVASGAMSELGRRRATAWFAHVG